MAWTMQEEERVDRLRATLQSSGKGSALNKSGSRVAKHHAATLTIPFGVDNDGESPMARTAMTQTNFSTPSAAPRSGPLGPGLHAHTPPPVLPSPVKPVYVNTLPPAMPLPASAAAAAAPDTSSPSALSTSIPAATAQAASASTSSPFVRQVLDTVSAEASAKRALAFGAPQSPARPPLVPATPPVPKPSHVPAYIPTAPTPPRKPVVQRATSPIHEDDGQHHVGAQTSAADNFRFDNYANKATPASPVFAPQYGSSLQKRIAEEIRRQREQDQQHLRHLQQEEAQWQEDNDYADTKLPPNKLSVTNTPIAGLGSPQTSLLDTSSVSFNTTRPKSHAPPVTPPPSHPVGRLGTARPAPGSPAALADSARHREQQELERLQRERAHEDWSGPGSAQRRQPETRASPAAPTPMTSLAGPGAANSPANITPSSSGRHRPVSAMAALPSQTTPAHVRPPPAPIQQQQTTYFADSASEYSDDIPHDDSSLSFMYAPGPPAQVTASPARQLHGSMAHITSPLPPMHLRRAPQSAQQSPNHSATLAKFEADYQRRLAHDRREDRKSETTRQEVRNVAYAL